MKTIIAGCRDCLEGNALETAIRESGFQISIVISGKAPGVDAMGERWARYNKIPVWEYPADWDLYGRRAGSVRNAIMADKADCLIALWDFKSPGTRNMIYLANKKGIPVHVHRIGA